MKLGHNYTMTWCHDDLNDDMMTPWNDDIITWWYDDTMTRWDNDTMTRCHDDINDDMMTRWNYDMKHNDENYQQFCWKIIIIQCNLPPPNYGRPLHPKLPPNRMTYIPSTMMKITNNFVEQSSLSSVTFHRQITVVHCTQNCHLLVWPIC